MYTVAEIQINNGVPAATPVIFKETFEDAQGEMYVKLGYAYQNPRDYTLVIIFSDDMESVAFKVYDNREEKVPVWALAEIQINEGTRAAVPVNVQVGENAESVIMQAYHGALQYAWNVKREYTGCLAFSADESGMTGITTRHETVEFATEEPEAEPEA